MATAVFDTLMFAKKLKQAGVTEEQAEVHAEALHEILENSIATKSDIVSLQKSLDNLSASIAKDMQALKNDIVITFGGMLIAATTVLGILMKIL